MDNQNCEANFSTFSMLWSIFSFTIPTEKRIFFLRVLSSFTEKQSQPKIDELSSFTPHIVYTLHKVHKPYKQTCTWAFCWHETLGTKTSLCMGLQTVYARPALAHWLSGIGVNRLPWGLVTCGREKLRGDYSAGASVSSNYYHNYCQRI